jgi:hypothetical protein
VILPAGTLVTPPDAVSTNQLRAVAVGETAPPDAAGAVRLTAPLQLVSPAYIAERDAAEDRYARRILELEARLTPSK